MDCCAQNALHPEALEIAEEALKGAPLESLAELFKVLGDPTRSGILLALERAGDERLCVCDLAELFEVTSAAISHHLRLLKAHRLVRSRRRGRIVYYSLDDDHVSALFTHGMGHVGERS